MNDSNLSLALADGACLTGSTGEAPDLRSILVRRLTRYYARRGVANQITEKDCLEDVQLKTAQEALIVIGRVQQIIGEEFSSANDEPPLIGTRDLIELRTLLSIVFGWGTDLLLIQIIHIFAHETPSAAKPRAVHFSKADLDRYASLYTMASDILRIVFPDGVHGRIPQTPITTTMLERHGTGILKVSTTLGWLPKWLASESCPVLTEARPMTLRFLNLLTPSQAIFALGGVLSFKSSLVPYVRRLCIHLLGKQLLRPQGVRGLCTAVFGGDDAENDMSMDKFQHVARVFMTLPNGTKPDDYFERIIPRIVALLLPQERDIYKRSAAFTISRMLSDEGSIPNQESMTRIIKSLLHEPFLDFPEKNSDVARHVDQTDRLPKQMALVTLTTLVSNADPSPTFISSLLSPILPTLYSLQYHVDRVKTTDPNIKGSLRGLLIVWAKTVDYSDGIGVLLNIIENGDSGWEIDDDGCIIRRVGAIDKPSLALLTPRDLVRVADMDENIFGLFPEPSHFVGFLQSMERPDIVADLFVKMLEAYRSQKAKHDKNPLRVLFYLQLVTQMQDRLTNGKPSLDILSRPTHLLRFIKHVLESFEPSVEIKNQHKAQSDIKLHSDMSNHSDVESSSDDLDSDDDTPGAETISSDSEMIETAINLLLSVLESNATLSATTQPVLNDIYPLLETLVCDGSFPIRTLAREARMVMTARLASISSKQAILHKDEENAHEIYQRALKLLQDPILPVRAHGLLVLRQLVTSSADDAKTPKLRDDTLIPAIFSIFLQAIQDDDSYLFLNGVQGLAAMVDRYGKDLLRNLIKEYAGGLDNLGATNMTQRDLDVRTRIGEALAAVIRRCGDTLGIYVDTLIPPLCNILSSRHIPTTLRTSSLSLLAECENTYPLAVLPYTTYLTEAMLDILRIEVVTMQPEPRSTIDEKISSTMDNEPLSTNSKFPPLRRAALNFLSLIIRETTRLTHESPSWNAHLPDDLVNSITTIVRYIASVDEDNVVRVMAKEVDDVLKQLREAKLGL